MGDAPVIVGANPDPGFDVTLGPDRQQRLPRHCVYRDGHVSYKRDSVDRNRCDVIERVGETALGRSHPSI
jgi:hypothetical protein